MVTFEQDNLYIRFQNSPIFILQNELHCTFSKNHEGIFSLSFLFTLLNYGSVNSKRAHPPPTPPAIFHFVLEKLQMPHDGA